LLGDKAEKFHVNSSTGEIVTLERLDRELAAVYHLTLVAQDSSPTEPRASAVNLTITVNDLNDNAPRFSSPRYTAYVPDSTTKGKSSPFRSFIPQGGEGLGRDEEFWSRQHLIILIPLAEWEILPHQLFFLNVLMRAALINCLLKLTLIGSRTLYYFMHFVIFTKHF
jgi:hypothetical protein